MVELPLERSTSEVIHLNDIALDLNLLGRRYLFLSFNALSGKLTLSLRVKPLLGHRGFYANVSEFDAFIELKRLPATFHHRVNENMLVKINLTESQTEDVRS